MRLQQGVMTYNEATEQPCFLAEDPLYMNYRCNAYQVRQAKIIICKLLSLKLLHLALTWKQVVYFVHAGANQAAASNFWQV